MNPTEFKINKTNLKQINEIDGIFFPDDIRRQLFIFFDANNEMLLEIQDMIKTYEYYPMAKKPYPVNKYEDAVKAAYQLLIKQLTLLEAMFLNTDETNQEIIAGMVTEHYNPQVKKEPNWTVISLDQKLPSNKINRQEYIFHKQNLTAAFKKNLQRDKHLDKVYMIFVHHYNKKKQTFARDCDNYTEKPLSDLIADYFINGGDGPENVARTGICIADDSDSTEVFLVPHKNINKWHDEHPVFQFNLY